MADETKGRRGSRARSSDEKISPPAAVSRELDAPFARPPAPPVPEPVVELKLPKAIERDLSALEAVDEKGRLTLEQRRVYVARVRSGVLQLLVEERARPRERGA